MHAHPSFVERWFPALAARKFRVLLALMVAALTAQPFVHRSLTGRILHEVLLLMCMLSVFVIFIHQNERWAAMALAWPAVAANLGGYLLAEHPLQLLAAHQACTAAFMTFAIFVILRTLFQQRTVGFDDLIGVFCGYLLAGIVWSNLYSLVELYAPGSYEVSDVLAWEMANADSRRSLFNYFSFTTLTTIGFGDVTPKHPLACSLAWIEAAFGQFYVAVLMAQLVGLKLAQPRHVVDDEA
jgi:hypothetical protein